MANNWLITESKFSAQTARAYEGLFTLGSGSLHIRGSLEEHLYDAPQDVEYMRVPTNVTAEKFPATKAKWGTYVPYIFGPHPSFKTEMINLPFFLGITPFVADEKLDMEKSRIEDYNRQLNMRTATLYRSLLWKTKSGPTISVSFRRFVSAVRPNLCLQQMALSSDSEVQVVLRTSIDANVRTSGYDHFRSVQMAAIENNGIHCCTETNGGDIVRILTQLTQPDIGWQFSQESRKTDLFATITIPAADKFVVEKRTAITTSLDQTIKEPETVLQDAANLTFNSLHQEHCKCWSKRWEKSDVIIEGDDESQQALRASIYHLLRCHVTNDSRVSIDGKGYSGDAYFGCYFWDTEMYMMPFFLYTEPQRARTLVDFRVQTLEGAKKNSLSYGYKGARYPWFTDTSGIELCPLWQYADHEVHITADVVYALAHYANAADKSYLHGPAAEVIVETARYWMDRIDWRPRDDYPSILGVMGPDEYTPLSNNNAYTNGLVSFSLDLAAKVGCFEGATDEERKSFEEVARKLPILRSSDGKVILQCEEFEQYAEPDFDKLWKDRSRGFVSQVPQEYLYRCKCLKQADVVMLMFVLPQNFTKQEMLSAWKYYLPYTTHDSSLSMGIHAIMAAWLGLDNEAWQMWRQSLTKDLNVEGGDAAEGIHIASCACNWMIPVMGFAGMRTAIQSDILSFRPNLPQKWTKLSFPVVWKQIPVFVEISHDRLILNNRGDKALDVDVLGQVQTVPAQDSKVFLFGHSGKRNVDDSRRNFRS